MRYLILSDLHANLEASRAVLEDARRRGFDEILCLGDVVGYGGDPNAVVDLVRSIELRAIVRGNHDKVAAGVEDGDTFSDVARVAAAWTHETLTADNRRWLADLPRGPLDVGGFLISHGTPIEEDAYILGDIDADVAFAAAPFHLAFFGHSHLACVFVARQGAVETVIPVPEGDPIRVDAGARYLVNPGSIGQPRDQDVRAAYALYDREAGLVVLHRIAYDVASAQRKITEQGLPAALALRLQYGV